MPIGALIGGAFDLWGNLNQQQTEMTLADEQRQHEVSERWRVDDLNKYNWHRANAYNEKRWNIQNEYNSPKAQMARFKAAGLNPHLIYGQGNEGNASTQAPAQTQKAETQKVTPRAQTFNLSRGIDAFQKHVQLKDLKARTDNLEAQTDLNRANKSVALQNAANMALNYDRGEFQFGKDKQLRETAIDGAILAFDTEKAHNIKAHSQARVQVDTADPQIQKAIAEAKLAKKKNKGQKLTNSLMKIELKYKRLGVDKSTWGKIMYNMFGGIKNADWKGGWDEKAPKGSLTPWGNVQHNK